MSRVEIAGLTKSYSLGGRTVEALRDVNLVIDGFSFVTVVGKSGCGKTTLLRVMCGLEPMTSGTVRFVEDDGRAGSPRVSIVFQEPRLMPWLTVEENMAFALRKEPDRARAAEKVNSFLQLLGLQDFRHAYPSQISGGMAQRVALGRTLCFDPDIILMDEPFGALDAFTRRNLQLELVNIFLSQRKTIFFVTHDVDEAIFLGQRLLVLDGGKLVKELPITLGYPRDLLSAECLALREEILGFFFR